MLVNGFITISTIMEITIKHYSLCKLIWTHITDCKTRSEKATKLVDILENTYGLSLNADVAIEIEKFLKVYEKKMRECNNSMSRFQNKNQDWLIEGISIEIKKKIRPPD